MPQFRVLFALLWAMVFTVPVAFAQNATPASGAKAEKSTVIVRDVKFAQTKLGGQMNPWNRMQVELMAGDNPDPKALNKKWVDKVKVTVTQVYKTASKKPEDWNYYRASATVLTIEANQPRSVLFYLPGDIVKRDVLHKEPDYYFVQVEVAGNESPIFDAKGTLIAAQARAVHKDIATKVAFDAAKDAADRGVVNTPGILRPQYLVSYQDNPVVPASPEFIREDVPSR
jgi:hypothetical protein